MYTGAPCWLYIYLHRYLQKLYCPVGLTPLLLCESESDWVVFNSLWLHGLYSPRNSPGQNTGVGSLSLLQKIFPTQGSNLGLPHCRQILYQLSHRGSPRILECVAYPFSSDLPDPGIKPGSLSFIAIGVVSSAYLRLLMFLPPTLIPACNGSLPCGKGACITQRSYEPCSLQPPKTEGS